MHPHRQPANDQANTHESGFILLVLIFMIALLLIGLAVAAPRIASSIQRDKETELVHRGEQYKRAIKLYYKKFGRYPASIDQLENTTNIRFLRKRYVDPMTGKDDWKIVHFGEAHVRPLGFFGQPLSAGGLTSTAGSSALGGAPGGGTAGSGVPGGSVPAGATGGGIYAPTPVSTSDSSTDSSGSGRTGTSTDSSSSTSSSGSSFGSSTGSSTFGNAPGTSSSSPFSSGSPGGSSFGGSSTGSSFGGSSTGSSAGSSFGSSGQSFGGAPMVGIVSKNTKESIKIYKLQKHYNEWEFIYDPLEDMLSSVSLVGGGGGNVNGTGNRTGTGTGNGFGNSGSGFGNSGNSFGGSSPTSGGGIGGGSGSGSGFGGGFGGSSPTSPQQ
jgi:type II secretory pathway pseudopilin PulG